MKYYVKILKEDDGFLVSSEEFPGLLTYGDTLEEAKFNAEEALNGILEVEVSMGTDIPEPKEHKGADFHGIPVHANIALAIELRRGRKERNQSMMDVARLLDVSYQAYQKLETPRLCNPTLKSLEKIAKALGKELHVSIR